jgi:hypothetical protein
MTKRTKKRPHPAKATRDISKKRRELESGTERWLIVDCNMKIHRDIRLAMDIAAKHLGISRTALLIEAFWQWIKKYGRRGERHPLA